MRILRSFALWCAALVVVAAVVILAAPTTPSATARVAHLESLVRCPSCTDLSVAQSNATSAIAVRHEIVDDVRAGKSDNQILTSIEDVYGPSIVLTPSTSGLGALLWVVPVAALLAVVLALVRLARRAKR